MRVRFYPSVREKYAYVKISDFTYLLPPERIAQAPLAERSASRLLVLNGANGAVRDSTMRDFPDLIAPGDLLVFNDTRVVAARILGRKASGGRVELMLERALDGDPAHAAAEHASATDDRVSADRAVTDPVAGGFTTGAQALVQLRASKAIRPGLEIETAGGTVRVLAREDDLWRIEIPRDAGTALDFFARWGETPLPPYIRRAPDALDRERYQSIFARTAGAVAAPTASLHFDEALVAALAARGAQRAFVTLHVGAGTFQPVRTQNLDDHVMHSERVAIDAALCAAVAATQARGARVIAVGTTVARALEAAAERGLPLAPWSGETRLFIKPGYRFRVVDALLTNFHLPESTLLMLVCAFAGTQHTLAAYAHAVREHYRFFSYGDAMFVTPQKRST